MYVYQIPLFRTVVNLDKFILRNKKFRFFSPKSIFYRLNDQMKYPKHLILDLSTPNSMPRLSLYRQRKNQRSSFTSNQLVLRRLTSVKFGKTLFDFVNLTYPSFSDTTSGDLSKMIRRIEDQRRHRYDP